MVSLFARWDQCHRPIRSTGESNARNSREDPATPTTSPKVDSPDRTTVVLQPCHVPVLPSDPTSRLRWHQHWFHPDLPGHSHRPKRPDANLLILRHDSEHLGGNHSSGDTHRDRHRLNGRQCLHSRWRRFWIIHVHRQRRSGNTRILECT